MALPGWSRALPPAAPLPSSGSGRADPGNLRAPQPMGERRPCPLPFCGATAASSALRSPPRAELRRASRAGGSAGTRDSFRPPRAPGRRRLALLWVTATAARRHPTLSHTPRLSGPAESRRGAPRYRGIGAAYGGSQITRVGGAQAPNPRQHGSAATPRGAASGLHTPS